MKARQWMQVAAAVSTIALAGSAAAATTNNPGNNMESGPAATATGAGGANNTNSRLQPIDTWMKDYAARHNGRITREEFMSQMENRWDTVDAQHHGYLSAEQAQGVFTAHPGEGARSESSVPTGPDVNPGYMGPASVKGK